MYDQSCRIRKASFTFSFFFSLFLKKKVSFLFHSDRSAPSPSLRCSAVPAAGLCNTDVGEGLQQSPALGSNMHKRGGARQFCTIKAKIGGGIRRKGFFLSHAFLLRARQLDEPVELSSKLVGELVRSNETDVSTSNKEGLKVIANMKGT